MIKDTWKPASQNRRLGVAEAKSKLSEVLRDVAAGPTIIHNRGKDLAVVLAIEEYERLTAGKAESSGGAAFLARIETLKQRLGGGVDDFEPARFAFKPAQPFGRKKASGG